MPFIQTQEERISELERLKSFLETEESNPFLNCKFVPAGFAFCNPKIVDAIDI